MTHHGSSTNIARINFKEDEFIEDACGGSPPHPHALCHALWGMIGQKIHRELLHLMIDFVENLSLILTPTGSQNQPQEGPKSWILGCWRGPGARLPLKLPKKAKR